nr:hypothetical protein [candidate division Zixibacteria bacterium]
MLLKSLNVRVHTPTDFIPRGRGFYQLEEEALYFPVEYPGERPRFFSFLDSEFLSFHISRDGRLLFLDLTLPRRRWRVTRNFIAPETALLADIRFLDFRLGIKNPITFCDRSRQHLMFRFSEGPAEHNYYLAENLIAQIDTANHLVAIWARDIVDDLAGQEILSWRRTVRGMLVPGHPPISVPTPRM